MPEVFRSQVPLLAPERHRAQEQEVFLVSEDRERDQRHQQEVTLTKRDLECAESEMKMSSQQSQKTSFSVKMAC